MTSARGEVQALYGLMKYYPNVTDITAVPIKSAEKSVRPFFAMNDEISFTRPASSSTTLKALSSFGDVPSSSANYNEDKKLVAKSADTTITNSLSEDKLSTEKSANNHAVTKYTNGVIQVPYGAKSLKIDSSAFSTKNANYISALANANGAQKYAVLGRNDDNLEIELASIVNDYQVGSKATVSFYAEQANPANTSDVISEIPVTVEIEVVEGAEQTIRYDLGGGSGNLPSNATIRAGKSYTLADGSGLNKNGNLFSRWKLTYTPYGETDEVTRLVKANEAIVVPDTTNGTITATAMYSGISSMKTTESSSSVVTVTWDVNSPENANAKFTDAATGEYNTARTKKYDKIKMAGVSVVVPTESDLEIDVTKIFDGWWTTRDESGTKLSDSDVQISPTANVTYYAHWSDGYRVTYDATGGSGLVDPSIAGKFANDATKLTESVLPRDALQGPKINGSAAEPVPSDETITHYTFLGWYTQPNGGGTKAELGTTTVTESITYYAHLVKDYKVTYDASGGTGASQTGKFSDDSTEDFETVLPGASTKGPSKGTPVADNSKYMFYGWYTQPNGGGTEVKAGTSFATLGGSKTVYAYYGVANTFLAPATSTVTANPRNISGTKYSIAQVKAAATDIASKGSDSSYYSQYTSWMNADSYHLYTLLNGKSDSSADSWVEFRIVNVGQLDSDGSGLTFQAVHMLPTAYQMNSTSTNAGGWASSALKTKMQAGGEIYSMFDTQLTSRVYNVTINSKGKLWIPSYSELTGTSQNGSQFAYWKGKVLEPSNSNSCLAIAGTRSSGPVASIHYSGIWWERSPSTNYSSNFMLVTSNGNPGNTTNATNLLGVVPCLSL